MTNHDFLDYHVGPGPYCDKIFTCKRCGYEANFCCSSFISHDYIMQNICLFGDCDFEIVSKVMDESV